MSRVLALGFGFVAACPTTQGSCGMSSPSTVKDCQNIDFGSCGTACCKLDFMVPDYSTASAVHKLNHSLAQGGPDKMYELQPTAEGSLGFADVSFAGVKGIDFIGQVFHTTKNGYVDTVDFWVQEMGSGSKVRAFSKSQIGGALADNGQNFKNIMMAMKTAFGTDVKFTSVDGSCPLTETKDVVEWIAAESSLSTLVSAVVSADLVSTLASDQWTIFAPTNEAFNSLPSDMFDDLMKPENKAKLVDILKYHVLEGQMLSSDLMLFEALQTLEGEALTVQMWGGEVRVGASVLSLKKVTSKDNQATNGVVHIIDGVLLPPNAEVSV